MKKSIARQVNTIIKSVQKSTKKMTPQQKMDFIAAFKSNLTFQTFSGSQLPFVINIVDTVESLVNEITSI
jgi:uncharacterized protein YdhG (YjbR/CyaY superfamily)